jgi:site-specific DNA-methyltransferase (adenine-specific)
MMNAKLYHGDCLEVMDELIANGIKVDAIITDPPYGITACAWDVIIPFDEMWKRLNKIIKSDGAIALFGSEPFSSKLRISNIDNFKYDWIWNKKRITAPFLAKKQPLRQHEIISVFYENQCLYNPQPTKKSTNEPFSDKQMSNHHAHVYGYMKREGKRKSGKYGFPKSILSQIPVMTNFSNEKFLHPTYKPIALMEYLVRTYTNEGDLVLDFTMGSGSTGVAARNTNRRFIGIEKDEQYFEIAQMRINKELKPPKRVHDENGFFQSSIFDFIE